MKRLRPAAYGMGALLFAASSLLAQNNGWPTANQQQQTAQTNPPAAPSGDQAPPVDSNQNGPNQNAPYPSAGPDQNQNQPQYTNQAPPPPYTGGPQYGPQGPQYGGPQYNGPQFSQRGPYGQNPNPYAQQAPPPPVPAQLTISPGTYVTVRINQKLSSDHNRPGDTFTATLVQPIVVNGVVVAEPGETVGGVVASAEKGETSKLVVQLSDLTLVDGQSLPIQTQLVARRGPGFNGNDAGTIVGTTGAGAIVGGVAGGGPGAAIGAVAGLTIGALVTNHHPSVLYPEQILTFRVQTAQTLTTQNAPQAFHYIEPGDYDRAPEQAPNMASAQGSPYYYASPYGYPYYPYYWGPSLGFAFYGGPWGYGRWGYGRPFYGVRGGYVGHIGVGGRR